MVIVVMGVCSCGKTTVGRLLASKLGVGFYDGDDFHPYSNVEKMKSGAALNDEDRFSWLRQLAEKSKRWQAAGGAVLACSALKESYRQILRQSGCQIRFVYLKGSKEQIIERMRQRKGHFMPTSLLDSQFADLEEPADAIVADISVSAEQIVEKVIGAIGQQVKKEYFAEGGPEAVIGDARAAELVEQLLARLGQMRRVLLVPPDFTRLHSGAGRITAMLYERLAGTCQVEIIPAIGTHQPMSAEQISRMFTGVPKEVFSQHNWRSNLAIVGEVPADFVSEVTDGRLNFGISCGLNRQLVQGRWDRIISIGQLVPHEVAGVSGHNKNILIGLGGKEVIDKTHFIGALYGIEKIIGRVKTAVREVLNYISSNFIKELPITYILTVRETDKRGRLVTRGLYAGDGESCFLKGASLALKVNLHLLESPIRKVVVHLQPSEFSSTWLGNKAIYRTRMAIADGGELIIMAPGVVRFGEDAEVDRLIRKYGYRDTKYILEILEKDADLAENLCAAAHLIHGSNEGRFSITYCTNEAAGGLTAEEVKGAGFRYASLDEMMKRYNPKKMRAGYNTLGDGEQAFYIDNCSLGLWGLRSQFAD